MPSATVAYLCEILECANMLLYMATMYHTDVYAFATYWRAQIISLSTIVTLNTNAGRHTYIDGQKVVCVCTHTPLQYSMPKHTVPGSQRKESLQSSRFQVDNTSVMHECGWLQSYVHVCTY